MTAAGAHDTLAAMFRRLIAATGPISLMHYMGEANARYYSAKDPLGEAGDFITAPEISQMFGELVGLWLADIWVRAGQPAPIHYVELGPGRGTLTADALRAARRHGLVPQVHLIEASPALRAVQQRTVPDAQWHHDLSSVPTDGPVLIVGNEFLDALPVRQLVQTAEGWRERMVMAEGERFACVAGQQPMDAAVPEPRRDAAIGTIIETCPGAAATIHEVTTRLCAQGGAALFIDYGHSEVRDGSTLQAVRNHQKVDPFSNPGSADLTALVDFATLAQLAQSHGAKWLGTRPQGAWLRDLGITARAQALAKAAPDQANAIRRALDRLVGDDQMGQLFKVMGLAAPDWPAGAGL
ncbi:MAG: hypothetical protein RLZZ427_1902 [Pseudomonadota bacterium]|jgi:NADH dehydrogenase [ubiquinone] 1 alpha subcomplex assembly factor 7